MGVGAGELGSPSELENLLSIQELRGFGYWEFETKKCTIIGKMILTLSV